MSNELPELTRLKKYIREDLMHTLENGRQPREGINLAYYNVIDAIDDLISESTELPEKPDFDRMANEFIISQPPYGDIGMNSYPCNLAYKAGMEKIWNDYHLPAQKRIKELEAALADVKKGPKIG